MNTETEYSQDDKTVLLDRQGHGPASSPLTDFAAPPRFEQLEERMIYAARLRPAEALQHQPQSAGRRVRPSCSPRWCASSTATTPKTCMRCNAATDRAGSSCLKRSALHNGAESSQVMARALRALHRGRRSRGDHAAGATKASGRR